MAVQFDTLTALTAHGFDAVIDVRTPAEFGVDHLPGAINLPVLSNAERARVGTIYKRENAFDAKKIGAALVAQNTAAHLQGPLAAMNGAWRPLVYCWRGGQRSGSFTSILQQIGWRAGVIKGGYQTYRRLVNYLLYETPFAGRLIVLEGNTGTAKTDLLHLLAARGVQVIDLEGLAAHRGSVFGAMPDSQPSQRGFESALAAEILRLDPAYPVVVEAESSKIGRLLVPPMLWRAMNSAARVRVSAPLAARAVYLVQAYGDLLRDGDRFDAMLAALIPHQGRARVEHWQGLAKSEMFTALAAELMADHYDPSYARSRSAIARAAIGEVVAPELTPGALGDVADRLVELVTKVSEQTKTV